MHVLKKVTHVSHGTIEIAGGDEAKGAFKTYESQDKDNVGPNRADEHDEIEDAHEQDKVCYRNAAISRCFKGSKGLHFIVPKLDKKPGDNAAGSSEFGTAYAAAAAKDGVRVAPYAKKNPP